MTILTKKQRALNDAAKVQTLVRIGRRAIAHADHLTNLLGTYYAEHGDDLDRARVRADIRKARDRAALAADEMLQIAESSDDLHLRRKARTYRTEVR